MVWIQIDPVTVGKARIWEWISKLGTLDAQSANIRQGLSNAFFFRHVKPNSPDRTRQANSNPGRKVLSSGACTTANPSITTFVGSVDLRASLTDQELNMASTKPEGAITWSSAASVTLSSATAVASDAFLYNVETGKRIWQFMPLTPGPHRLATL